MRYVERTGRYSERLRRQDEIRGPSFVDHLPWVEFLPESQALLLEDGRSVGAVYELIPVATEGRSVAWLENVRDRIADALQDSFDEDDKAPWVVQFFCQDEDDADSWLAQLSEYAVAEAKNTDFTREWLAQMQRHLNNLSRPEGLFLDNTVTRTRWRARWRRTRMVIYRWLPSAPSSSLPPEMALNHICERIISVLKSAGITALRQNEQDIHRWLLKWFNPAPVLLPDKKQVYRTLDLADATVLTDFAERLLLSEPRSDSSAGVWWLDSQPHKVVVVDRLRRVPQPSLLTGETSRGEGTNALFDLLPPGSILSMTVVIHPQDLLEDHLNLLANRAIGENIDSEYTRRDCQEVKHYLHQGHKLYRSALAFYLTASDLPTLRQNQYQLNSTLLNAGLVPVQENHEVAPLSAWLRWLPMCFDPSRDKRALYTRFNFVQHLASLAPLWGRETGTGNPGISYFNRGGAPLCFDPLNKLDRAKNGHLLLLGPTGAGKSATLNAKIAQLLALHRPRLFIVEAGNSFGLIAQYAGRYGLSVNRISLHPGSGVTLPLFADAWRLVAENIVSGELPDSDEQDDNDEQRDILGEMEITARLMITGGEHKEDARLTRPDRAMIRQAIIAAANICHQQQRQTLTQDVREALFVIAKDETLPAPRRNRAYEMAESINLFCSGFEGELFNREGQIWPEADITLVDLATFAREGYEAQLAIAYISLINHINNLGERDQHLARAIVNITDEAHIITVNPLLAKFLAKGSKMWRKLGIWLWLATQNLADFPDEAKKLLNMIEWWELLVMPEEEIAQVCRFKALTEEQRLLLQSARKSPGQYTEGVVLSSKTEGLFRVVPPPLYLALAMTEKHEKAERYALMQALGISELDAAIIIAEKIEQSY
ncbi:conjugative transfer ATPase [Erwinia toletana]|uniref:Conjugative transfer ATPase n=1 Tax=Winslowiella toletana TaxID=92490 RepID=A0ABS4PDM5_9GAMM|nr:conjugative transfer ATPase [Winslowiella toletana]MBP2170712.1 conjugative transfer ATPase [Winslowiella toletana]